MNELAKTKRQLKAMQNKYNNLANNYRLFQRFMLNIRNRIDYALAHPYSSEGKLMKTNKEKMKHRK